MSTTRTNTPPSTFARFLAREDVRAVIIKNIADIEKASDESKLSFLRRILNNVPSYSYINPLLRFGKEAAINNEQQAWLDFICAIALADLFDTKGKLKQEINAYLRELLPKARNELFTDEDLGQALYSSYMELVGGQLAYYFTEDLKKNNITKTTMDKVTACIFSLNDKRAEILKRTESLWEIHTKLINNLYYSRIKSSQFGLATQVYKLKIDFEEAYTCLAQHISTTKQEFKRPVLDEAANIYQSIHPTNFKQEAYKVKLLTDILNATAYTYINQTSYSKLIKKISEHAWGKRLAAAMAVVPLLALAATCVLFSIATAGVGLPILAGIGFATLLGVSIASGTSAIATAVGSGILLWQGLQNKPVADAMKKVRDHDPMDFPGFSAR